METLDKFVDLVDALRELVISPEVAALEKVTVDLMTKVEALEQAVFGPEDYQDEARGSVGRSLLERLKDMETSACADATSAEAHLEDGDEL